MKTIIASLALAVLATGCSTTYPTAPEDANFGSRPENHEGLVRQSLLADCSVPEDAQFRFAEPRPAFVNQGLRHGGQYQWTGYGVDIFVKHAQLQDEREAKYVALVRNDLGKERVILVEPASGSQRVIHYAAE